MDSCSGLLAKLDAGMDDVSKSETKEMLQNKERSLMESKAKRDQGDGASGIEEESEGSFQQVRKPPPLVYTPQLDVMWLILLGLAAGTRMVSLMNPSSVVFDEVHFGRFTSYFMQNKFFFDVHPPLGKLLFALVGYLSGFDGKFMFEQIGQGFGEHAGQIWYLRLLPAIFSTLLVPCMYEILLELGCTYWMATLGAVLVIFENMLVVQGRFILMDSMLIFFIAASVCFYLKFLREHHSVKYNGLLTVLLIGAFTFLDIWRLIGDIKCPLKNLWHHIFARAGCLFGMPIVLYLFQFYIMFAVLTETGPHDDYMSSSFQRTLNGGLAKITENQADEVAYGSQITLRNTHKKQCWLHSHSHLYPVKYPDGRGSSAQQQVTCYAFKDINNWWIVKRPDSENLSVEFPPKPVKNGDVIHLVHGTTGRGLNSHDVAAPLNPYNMEVSGYIDHNVSMSAQLGWRVEILNPDPSNVWKVIESQVRFIHINTSTSIKVTGAVLPDWGFHQFEVATGKIINTEESIWNAEEHNQNVTIPEGMDKSEVQQKIKASKAPGPAGSMSFISKFLELQTRMLRINSELVQEHTFSSRPFDWPFMKRGVAYWISNTSNAQVFCIGNPVIWWAGTLAVLGYCGLFLFYLLRRRRAIYDLSLGQWQLFTFIGLLTIGGGYPILQKIFGLVCVGFAVLVLMSFKHFSPFTYGFPSLSAADIMKRKWLSGWEFLINKKN
eukprot:gene10235-18921_t